MANEKRKNNLLQESLYLLSLNPTPVREEVINQLNQVSFEVEYRADDTVFKKYATAHVAVTVLSLFFIPQFGFSFWEPLNVGKYLMFLGGPITSMLFGGIYAYLSLVGACYFVLNQAEYDLLVVNKVRYVYGIIFFSGILLASFGPVFTWLNLLCWYLGAYVGIEQGLRSGLKLIQLVELIEDKKPPKT